MPAVSSSLALLPQVAPFATFSTLSSPAQIRSSNWNVWMMAVSASSGPFPVTSSTVAMSESLHHNTSNHSFLQSLSPLRPKRNNNRRSERMLRHHAQSNDEMTRQDWCERQDGSTTACLKRSNSLTDHSLCQMAVHMIPFSTSVFTAPPTIHRCLCNSELSHS